MSDDPHRLSAWASFVHSLTPTSVALTGVMVLIGVLGYAAFEARLVVAQAFFGSPLAIGLSVFIVLLVLCGVALSKMVGRAEQRAENAVTRAEGASRDRERGLQQLIDSHEQRLQGLQTQNNEQAAQLADCHRNHADALLQVAKLANQIAVGRAS